ncbi:MAG: guanylate kinase [Bacilli bacterium]
MNERGMLIILSGPSGVGKGTVRSKLFEQVNNISYSVSMTTRTPREGEVHGVDYFFVDDNEFMKNVESGNMLEWAEFVGNKYGTPLDKVEDILSSGKDVMLEIEIQGALQVKEKVRDGLFIFLMPTSLKELENRLRSRGSETEDIIMERLDKAKRELPLREQYNYVVINDEVDKVCSQIIDIINLEKTLRREL